MSFLVATLTGLIAVAVWALVAAQRGDVISTHQCTATVRVAEVQVNAYERHHAVQVWGCVDGGCDYWTTATYETRDQALVHCHDGKETRL